MEAIPAATSTSRLAAPFDLTTMPSEVASAARQVLHADRGSAGLYDRTADEPVIEIETGIAPVRVPAGTLIVSACAPDRGIINVPDCEAGA